METFIQAMIVAFREGLEAFLIIAILLQFLNKTNNKKLKLSVWQGVGVGVLGSFLLGGILMFVSYLMGGTSNTAKLWESIASFVAVILITTFIIWMIKHGSRIKKHVEEKAAMNLSKWGIFLLSMILVLREGAEIAIFAFAGKYTFWSIVTGIVLSLILVVLIFKSIVNIKLSTLFNITLAYLVLQAGFLAGYSVHEGLSAAKGLELIDGSNPIYNKAFDLSATPLNHKTGTLGIPLYVAVGWYSKPEWIQFLIQYGFTLALFGLWYLDRKKQEAKKKVNT